MRPDPLATLHRRSVITDNENTVDVLTAEITISETGAATGPDWQAVTDGSWLTLSQYEGTGPSIVTVSALPWDLAAGTYYGSITVTADVSGSPQTVQVILTVSDAGGGEGD
jgi:hypothetical protein